MPKVDAQFYMGVPPPDDLDRPQSRLVAPHANPGDRFYNPDPIARSNPGSRGSSTEPMDTDEGQRTTNRLAQAIRDSSRLHRSGSLEGIPSAPFQLPVAGAVASATGAMPTTQSGVAPIMPTTNILIPGVDQGSVANIGERKGTPRESIQREVERTSLLNIPPYASHEGVEGEDPTLHRPEVVEPPEIFQRDSGIGARPKNKVRYNTRTVGEERDHGSHGEQHLFAIRTDFYLPLPGQLRITELHAWRAPIRTEQGNEGIYVRIDEWKDIYGQMYM